MGEDWDTWASIIRSMVLTSKVALTLKQLNGDIRTLEGQNIPFRAFGCDSLMKMLRKIDNLEVFEARGETLVRAIANEQTAHIQEMVSKQKSDKKKSRAIVPRQVRSYPSQSRFQNYSNSFRTPPRKYNNYNNHNNYNNVSSKPSYSYNDSKSYNSYSSYKNDTKSYNGYSTQKKAPSPTPSAPKRTPTPPQTPTPTPQKSVSFGPAPSAARSSSVSGQNGVTQQQNSVQQRLNVSTPILKPQVSAPTPEPSPLQARLQNNAPAQVSSPSLARSQSVPCAGVRLSTPPSTKPQTAPSTPTTQNVPVRVPSPPLTRGSIQHRLEAARSTVPVQQVSNDPRIQLLMFTQKRRWPDPVYKDVSTHKQNSIYSKVNVNGKDYKSFPHETTSKDEAEKLAAQIALDSLKETGANLTVTTDHRLIQERIVKLVHEHPINGFYEKDVDKFYESIYNESLPNDWIKVVENQISFDKGVNNLTILRPRSVLVSNAPGVLKIDHMDEFWMRIFVVNGTTEVWGVIIDDEHYDKIEKLSDEMKEYYEKSQSLTSTAVMENRYYAILDSDSWHRVRCTKVDTKVATAFFIDRGDTDEFPISQLRPLESQFCQVSAQAVRFSMDGFEVFQDSEEARKILEELILDKDVFVKNMGCDNVGISVQLFMEDDGREKNVNKLFKNEIINKIGDPTPMIGLGQAARKVHISYVSENDVYVQLNSNGLKYLKKLMKCLTEDYLDNSCFTMQPVLKLDASKIYVTKLEEQWYRIKITKIESENLAHIVFIDLGETAKAHRSSLFVLEDLSDLLSHYPPQAVKVFLHKISPITFDKKMADHLRKLAPIKETFYMKVVGEREKTPVVEFYKRTESNLLASLNDTLALDSEMAVKDDNNNAKPAVKSEIRTLSRRSSLDSPLGIPDIPAIGDYFDVWITMAAHPGNFTVQPFKTAQKLEKLMIELSKNCNNFTGPALTPGSLKVGSMCAAKYDDGRWYRASISKVISDTAYAVYFVDYGDFKVLSMDHLQSLDNKFLDLPAQAIKSKLFGVRPKLQGDWSVKDSLRFNELVVNKSLVSKIRSKGVDESGVFVIGIELTDTSDPREDLHIIDVLVSENRAEPCVV